MNFNENLSKDFIRHGAHKKVKGKSHDLDLESLVLHTSSLRGTFRK